MINFFSKKELLNVFIFKKYLKSFFINNNGIVFLNVNIKYVDKYIYIIKNSLLFLYMMLLDICCVDLGKNKTKYLLYYNLYSYYYNNRIFVSIYCINELNKLNSLEKFYKSANWLEREVWDMFGVYFVNHMDLRRILTDYGFKGFPLLKSFPLTGFYEIRYNDTSKMINYDFVRLTQEYRYYYFNNSWI